MATNERPELHRRRRQPQGWCCELKGQQWPPESCPNDPPRLCTEGITACRLRGQQLGLQLRPSGLKSPPPRLRGTIFDFQGPKMQHFRPHFRRFGVCTNILPQGSDGASANIFMCKKMMKKIGCTHAVVTRCLDSIAREAGGIKRYLGWQGGMPRRHE